MSWRWPRRRGPVDVDRYQAMADKITGQAEELAGLKVELAKRTGERGAALAQMALKQAEIVALRDKCRTVEASLFGVREQLRQERVERARAERDAAEARVTADGLGLAMAELEKRRERNEFLEEDHRHVRLADGTGDHL